MENKDTNTDYQKVVRGSIGIIFLNEICSRSPRGWGVRTMLCLRVGLFMFYVTYFSIIIFTFIVINHIISLKHFFFGHVPQKFSLRVLLSFCLMIC